MSKPSKKKPVDTNNVVSDVEELHKHIIDLTQALQQERADSMNLRRRHDEQLINLKNYVKVEIIRELLPVIDNFERSLKHIPKDLSNNDYIQGIKGIIKQFEDTLKSIGVEKIKTVGEHFDPTYHEAVSMEEGDGTHEVVSEELQPGYKLGNDVIRHAVVKVKLNSLKQD